MFEYSPEILKAKQQKQPIVALESTLITHGLPHPINIETAIALENIAREQDVIPATIAILKGKIKVGLSEAELYELVAQKELVKASQRDISFVTAKGFSAGTTIAATLSIAQQNNISGKAITPFILNYLNKLNNIDFLSANITLLKNNVDLGAKLAKKISYERHR